MANKLFFSYTTVAPLRKASYDAIKEFLEEFYIVGPPEVLYKYDPMFEDLANEAAKLLNCDPEEITYVKNTTEAISIASQALPLKKGDEVLVLGNEYPANLLPWLRLREDGVVVSVIEGKDNKKATEELISSIGPKTKAIAISSSQCYDGFMVDLKMLSDTCRKNNIFLALDAVQTVGVHKIDLQNTPVDFLACGGQKYLQAGMGIGFMYVNKNVIPKLRDIKAGIRSMQKFDEQSYILKNNASRFQDGTQNLTGIVSLTAALHEVNKIGIENIEKKNLQLLKEFRDCLKKYSIPIIDHGDHQGNIIALTVNNPQSLFEYLKERSVYIKPIKDVARVSFIHESRLEDVEQLAKLTREWLDSQS
jgi:cysteine desulfurase / selenocysteine lyase